MNDLQSLTEKINAGIDLDRKEGEAAALALASPEVDPAVKETFLVGLADKGESAEEVGAFSAAFRSLALDPGVAEWADRAIDLCGTGGDRLGTFNISTVVSLIVAAAGIPVFKHGNRSITSSCGSADLLAALGVRLEIEPEMRRRSLEELNFVFFFAPAFHPAFKEIVPIRKALAAKGRRTVFNILGPLINPGKPAYQLLGVFSEEWMPVMAGALHSLDLKGGCIAHGKLSDGRGMDELSCAGRNRLLGFGERQGSDESWESTHFGLPPCPLAELVGGDLETNLFLFSRLLAGDAPGGLFRSILLNAGVAFSIAGEVKTVKDGIELAREKLLGGDVARLVTDMKEFYQS